MRPQVKSRRRCSRSRRSQIRRPQQASMEFRRAASQPPVTSQATRTGFLFRVNATATAGATGWRLRESRQTNNARARRASARYRAMEQRPLAIANVTIRGVIACAHTILFAEDAERARAFLRDVLGFEGVDAGDGWLIFALPPGELAVHPGSGWGRGLGHHALFFMCHDIEQTVEQLEAKGVEFVSPIEDEGWGRIAQFEIPGAGEIGVYEPQ